LEKDPGETQNLAAEKPKKLQALKADMYAWRQRTDSPVPTKLNPKYIPQKISTY